MFSTPLNPDLIKAQTAYRHERNRRQYHTPTRRERRAERHANARRAHRYTKAA